MGIFGGKKKSLEEMAREALKELGVEVVSSPPNGKEYEGLQITGYGNSETDLKGAVHDFRKKIFLYGPQSVCSFDTVPARRGVEKLVSKISVTAYRPASLPAA